MIKKIFVILLMFLFVNSCTLLEPKQPMKYGANVAISTLSADSPADTDIYWIQQGGNPYKISLLQTRSYVSGQQVTCASNATLSISNVTATTIGNYGQSGTTQCTLPAAASGYSFVVYLVATGNSWKVTANGSDVIILNGTAGSAGQSVIDASPTIYDCMTCFTVKTGSSAYSWACETKRGSWAAGA